MKDNFITRRMEGAAKRPDDPEWIQAQIDFEVARRQATTRCRTNDNEEEQKTPHHTPFYD